MKLREDFNHFSGQDYEHFVEQFAKVKNYNVVKCLGHGAFGMAYLTTDKKVIKITTTDTEANSSFKLIGKKPEYMCDVYEVYQLEYHALKGEKVFAIVMEYLEPLNEQEVELYIVIDRAYTPGMTWEEFEEELNTYVYKETLQFWEAAKDFYMQMNRIYTEMGKYGVSLGADLHWKNVGKKNGHLAAYDIMALSDKETHKTININ